MSLDKRIKKVSMSDHVYETLHDHIVNGDYKIGDKLPSESEIAAQLGVNRLTVRLALQKLSTLGFVETRVGEGSFVIGIDYRDNLSEISKYFMGDDIIEYVEEFRSTIELRCIELAVENASDEELDMLEKCCDRYEQCQRIFIERDDDLTFEQLVEADYVFHRTLCELSHNKLYSYSYSLAKEPICRHISLLISERDERKRINSNISVADNMDIHRRLIYALRRRDVRRCQRIFDDIVDYDST